MTAGGFRKKATRRIQAECGVRYCSALEWAREHEDSIWELVERATGERRCRDFPGAAAGLWRARHPDASES